MCLGREPCNDQHGQSGASLRDRHTYLHETSSTTGAERWPWTWRYLIQSFLR